MKTIHFRSGKKKISHALDRTMGCCSRLRLIEPKKCPTSWVSNMFSIWKHRYSHGICFGSVCVFQNSTPHILSFFLSAPEGLKKCIFYVGDHDYTILTYCIYIYIYMIVHIYIYIHNIYIYT